MNLIRTLFAEILTSAIIGFVAFYVLGKAFAAIAIILPWFRSKRSLRRDILDWLILSGFALAIFFLADVVILLAPYAGQGYSWAMQTLGLQAAHLLLAASVISLGIGAFFFKTDYQPAYGVVELLFAAVGAVIAARQIHPGGDWSGQIATLIGCVYIVSRGLGNIKDGLEAKDKEKSKKEAESKKEAVAAKSVP